MAKESTIKVNVNNLLRLSEGDKGYLAGILERCSFGINPIKGKESHYRIIIALRFPDEKMATWMYELIGGSLMKRKKNGKDSYVWQVSGKKCSELLRHCYLYLKGKRAHANVMILFCSLIKYAKGSYRGGRHAVTCIPDEEKRARHDLYLKFKELNLYLGKGKRLVKEVIDIKQTIDILPQEIRGLFDFDEDLDGFGETISFPQGFFDSFIDSLED